MVFDAPDVKVLRDEVVLAIEKAIFVGDVVPGQRLIEADIARQMGVSKAPVREALRQLEQLGLVVSHPRRGTFVTQLSTTLASEAFSLRAILESHAVRLAVAAFGERDVERIENLMARSEVAPTSGPCQPLDFDLEFHDLIFAATGHRLLQQAWANLRAQIRLLLTVTNVLGSADARPERILSVTEAHAPIVAALRARDADRAEAAVVYHLAAGERLLLSALSASPPRLYVRLEAYARRPDLAQSPRNG